MKPIKCPHCKKIYFNIDSFICPFCKKNITKSNLKLFTDLFGKTNPFKDLLGDK